MNLVVISLITEVYNIYMPQHEKMYLLMCVLNEDSNQPCSHIGIIKKEYLGYLLDYFFQFSKKHMLWVLIRSASARRF